MVSAADPGPVPAEAQISVCGVAGSITDNAANGILAIAEDLVERVHAWLLQNYPEPDERELIHVCR